MANPTTNFGWVMPTSTDLVTDLPADFEVFGQAVDTSLVDLKGGTTGQILSKTSATDMDFTWINNDQGDITAVTAGTGISGGGTSGAVTVTNSMATAITTNGDLIYGTGSGTFSRLGIGSSAQVLTVASGVPSWATPVASDSLTLLSTTTLSGASTTISLSGTYKNLQVIIGGVTFASGSNVLRIAPNGNTNLADMAFTRTIGTSASNVGLENDYIQTYSGYLLSDANNSTVLNVYNYQSTTRYKTFHFFGGFKQADPANFAFNAGGVFKSNSAITSLVISGNIANLSGGTVLVYGEN